MKLNTKRTVLVGFAFLSICAFWQMYDNLIPKILTETFHMGESVSGMIMQRTTFLPCSCCRFLAGCLINAPPALAAAVPIFCSAPSRLSR